MPALSALLACALCVVVYLAIPADQTEIHQRRGDTPGYFGPPYVAPSTPKYDYSEVLHKSLLFYHSQRSGAIDEQRLAWRSDSCLTCTGKYGEDLSGGWYEAANTMKWTQPKAWTVTQLAFSIYQFGDAMASVNEKTELLNVLKWGADYLINAHPRPNVLVGCLGVSEDVDGRDIDFGYFGPPEEYDRWVPKGIPHVPYYVDEQNPSSEMAGQAAAALAATSVVWRSRDPVFANNALKHARELYTFATTFLATYKYEELGFRNTQKWYPSQDYTDELTWAGIWLYIATNEAKYLNDAKTRYASIDTSTEYSWDDQGPACTVLLYKITGEQFYADKAKEFFDKMLPGIKQTVKQTPKGLSFLRFWGSLRYSANHAFLALVQAKVISAHAGPVDYAKSLQTFAVQQINYILGDCGRSWVVGFGYNSPLSPYHKSSYNSYIDYPLRGHPNEEQGEDFLNSATVNRFILYGALVGGPAGNDSYVDNRKDYEYTEVTQDYNAGFTGALGGLTEYYLQLNQTLKPFSDCHLDLGWNHPNAEKARKPKYAPGDCYHTCDPCSKEIIAAPLSTGSTQAPSSPNLPGSAPSSEHLPSSAPPSENVPGQTTSSPTLTGQSTAQQQTQHQPQGSLGTLDTHIPNYFVTFIVLSAAGFLCMF